MTLVLLLAIGCTAAAGRTIYVDDDGPADFNNIQAAIDDANDGHTVLVAPGVYDVNEPITYRGKNITLKSEAGPDATTIRMQNPIDPERASVFIFYSEREEARLEGFTITGGRGTKGDPAWNDWYLQRGGGILCAHGTAPTIKGNRIIRNRAEAGGGIYGGGAHIIYNLIGYNTVTGGGGGICPYQGIIENNIIMYNTAGYGGGGILLVFYEPLIIDNVIAANAAQVGGGIYMANPSGSAVFNNLIVGNSGGGIYLEESGPDIVNNVIADNRDYGVQLRWNEGAKISNSIIWDNDENNIISDIPIHSRGITYNDIQGGWHEEGNIDADPLFVKPNPDFEELESLIDSEGYERAMNYLEGRYHLKSQAGRYDPNSQTWVQDPNTSPCIDAGDPMTPIGPEPFPNGGIINMGAYGGTAEASKSYFGEPPCQTIVAGDINGDCEVNFKDLAIMGLHWLDIPDPDDYVPSL